VSKSDIAFVAAGAPLTQTPLRAAITAATREDETPAVARLVDAARMPADVRASAEAMARALVQRLRAKRGEAGGVEMLMREFSLSSEEGVALMCLAEALLRIPDRATADQLIRDKVGGGDWEKHLGRSGSLFVNAATWGLLVTGKLVATNSAEGLSGALAKLVARGGEPVIRGAMDLAMRLLGRQFVLGETIADALSRSGEAEARGYRHSYDMLGEAALTADDAARYYSDYETAIHAIGKASAGRGVYAGPGISVKLSALHPRYGRANRERVLAELVPCVRQLMLLALNYDIGFTIDAEETDRLDLSLDVIEALALDRDLAPWNGFGLALQAYQKRAPRVIDWLADLAQRSRRRLMLRLVKGAYWDTEIKRAQVDGQAGYPVFTRKPYTDVCYLACAKKLLARQELFFPQFATHNAATLATIAVYAQSLPSQVSADDYEFQCLHGMGESLYDEIVGDEDGIGRACRIYAPVGTHETLLAYLVRRLLENGANSSFVHRIVDANVDPDELIADPVGIAQRLGCEPHPAIPLPAALYAASTGRRNSSGIDLADESTLGGLSDRLGELTARPWLALPTTAGGEPNHGDALPIRNPANHDDIAGYAIFAGAGDIGVACASAAADLSWISLAARERAAILERAADLLETERDALAMLCVREAGKTLPNAYGEVREAADFCRYYANQARHLPGSARALGPVACISPWNFPLAIFTGQVAAALAAGNTVLAKPAEQTPLVAAFAVDILHRAGVPDAALHLLPGAGDTGAALVSDPRVRGVVFTGSNEAAHAIARALAARGGDLPLIAETGGQNAMLVDSSALPEQVVADVVASAFDSAGQRCSALRVLFLQDEIADRVIGMLKGAMQELAVGDPALLATDVGPVIDADAQARLQKHLQLMRRTAKWHFELALPKTAQGGTFVAPFVCEIDGIGELTHEVFGPVLHVVRYARENMGEMLDAINATGYALTAGVHSRIDETIAVVASRSRAGNLYVNRNMIGAVVGVQPFGGEGWSGTGPKAGGPLYVSRLTQGAHAGGRGFAGTRRVAGEAASPDALEVLQDWLRNAAPFEPAARDALLLHCAEMREASLAGIEIELAGPTGERNTLSFSGKGQVIASAADRNGLLAQLAAVLATGNHALVPGSDFARDICLMLPAALRHAVELRGRHEDWLTWDFDAVLFEGTPEHADSLRRKLAARAGAIVPLVVVENGCYPLERLVVERAVSINTAAAGGNATLMRLA
jgi:RHH-type transcriptional regulator, proline utilization regulon repressor / proline dehydrogenase / delta 1-pyrroline-5-carboxylate dehydrogenase